MVTTKPKAKAAPKAKAPAKSGTWPKVTVGSHLTVTEYEDGHTELTWDDEALARDVREATAAYELDQLKPAVKAKAAVRRKKAQ